MGETDPVRSGVHHKHTSRYILRMDYQMHGAIIGLSLMRIRSSSEAGLNIGNFHGTNEFGSSPIFIHASLWPGDETAAI